MNVWFDPSGFIKSVLDVCPWCLSLMSVLDVCPWCLSLLSVLAVCPCCLSLLGLSQCLCPALSTEVNLSPSGEGNFSSSPPLADSQTWCPISPWSMGCYSRSVSLPYSKGSAPRLRVTRELFRGFGNSGSSISSCPSISLDNLLFREDFPRSTHGVGVT